MRAAERLFDRWCRSLRNRSPRSGFHRKDPLSQHAILIPDLLRPDARHDLPSMVEAIAEQAKRPDLQVGKRYIGGIHRSAGILIADSLWGKLQHHVQCHAVPNRIALKAKLDAELGADLADNLGRFRDEMPIRSVPIVQVGDDRPARSARSPTEPYRCQR